MDRFPESVRKAWENRKGPLIFTTVDPNGIPNSVYVGAVSKQDDGTIIIADNYFDKTRRNILSGSKGSLLFITEQGKSFQMKGDIGYHTEGPLFENMKNWNSPKHPGHAAVAFKVTEVYTGAEKLV